MLVASRRDVKDQFEADGAEPDKSLTHRFAGIVLVIVGVLAVASSIVDVRARR